MVKCSHSCKKCCVKSSRRGRTRRGRSRGRGRTRGRGRGRGRTHSGGAMTTLSPADV